MLTVGQKLWYVPRDARYRNPQFVTVTKIGRKWAEIDGGWCRRIDVKTLVADGGGYTSPGACYVSKEDYEIEHAADQHWRLFRSRVERLYNRPLGVRSEDIEAAAKTLGVSLE